MSTFFENSFFLFRFSIYWNVQKANRQILNLREEAIMQPDTGFESHTLSEAEAYLNSIPRFSSQKHSAEDLRAMLDLLEVRLPDDKVIHVAGTNGKGSVCAFLDSILRTAGKTTAVFTSPHLVKITERFAFNGVPVSDETFLSAYRTVRRAEPDFALRGWTVPTYFETIFLIFAVLVRQFPTDWIILETGLGGRLDATNCVEYPRLTVITSISFDHMQYLGNTIPEIAGEKAGIMKPGVPLVHDDTDPEASEVFRRRAEELSCRRIPVGTEDLSDLRLTETGLSYLCRPLSLTRAPEMEAAPPLMKFELPFRAHYQGVNSLLAVRAAELLGFSYEVIREGLAGAAWPGRMEEIAPGVFADGAHNEGGIRAFCEAASGIRDFRKAEEVTLIFEVSSDKQYTEMLSCIAERLKPDRLILCSMKSYRALSTETLLAAAERVFPAGCGTELTVIPSLEEAFRGALDTKKPGGLLFIAGSLYLVGELQAMLREETH